jgi:ABC-2 type transport system permease protein
VFITLLKINIQQELAYRTDALVKSACDADVDGLGAAHPQHHLQQHRDAGGWGVGELIALLGVFRLVHTLMAALVWPNTEKFNTGMRDGSLDYTLLQPAPSLFLVTFSRIIIWRAADLVLAVVLLIVGLTLSGDTVTPVSLLSFGALLAGGMAIFYSLWVVMMAVTFWFIKFDNNVTILQALLEAGRYPATVYPPWLRLIVTFVVPIAVTTTVPCRRCAASWGRGRWRCSLR